ncbi:MAG: aldo/keto reductase [Ilumatobacteraceae bacterium]
MRRRLGEREVSALGLGGWAIGGPFFAGDQPQGWGEVDDDESIRAIHRALDLGVSLFDTAAVYGCGHSERVLGRALAGRFDTVAVATKFGIAFDETTRQVTGPVLEPTPDGIRAECEASLRRLGTDVIDVFQCHPSELPIERAAEVRDVLDDLVADGLVRGHGWSTDDPAGAAIFAESPNCVAVQHEMNVLRDAPAMVDLCRRTGLAEIIRTPLGMGVLTGKFDATVRFADDDVRRDYHWNPLLAGGAPEPEALARLDAIRDVLTSDGRTPAQGALGWLWARSDRAIPIPGFRTVVQVEDNAGAMAHGPLRTEQMADIAQLLASPPG